MHQHGTATSYLIITQDTSFSSELPGTELIRWSFKAGAINGEDIRSISSCSFTL
ncbi:Hypothetical predicted protein, partial [Podarcis lilfordi]